MHDDRFFKPTLRTLVVCDDRPEVRDAIVRAVSLLTGFRVIGEATDATTCLLRIRDLSPVVLTLDIGMPGGGPDLVKAVRALDPALHIVVFSARDDQEVQAQMLDAGADAYVLKSGRLSPLIRALLRSDPQEPFGSAARH